MFRYVLRGTLTVNKSFKFYRQLATMSSESMTPMEDAIRQKVTEALAPTTLEIFNDSSLHSHHKAMRDNTSKETHFRVSITSPKFESMTQLARHRMVNGLLKEELAMEGGIHALQLRTKTPAEEERLKEREAVSGASADN